MGNKHCCTAKCGFQYCSEFGDNIQDGHSSEDDDLDDNNVNYYYGRDNDDNKLVDNMNCVNNVQYMSFNDVVLCIRMNVITSSLRKSTSHIDRILLQHTPHINCAKIEYSVESYREHDEYEIL
jgi:hypothetical protein